jgi:hypothetical protein
VLPLGSPTLFFFFFFFFFWSSGSAPLLLPSSCVSVLPTVIEAARTSPTKLVRRRFMGDSPAFTGVEYPR